MERGEDVVDFISRVDYLRCQLSDLGIVIEEATAVTKIVSGLPASSKSLGTQWASTKEHEQTIARLTDRLLEEQSLQEGHQKAKRGDSVTMFTQSNARKPNIKPKGKAKPRTFKGK